MTEDKPREVYQYVVGSGPKSEKIEVRLTKPEKEFIQDLASRIGWTISDLVREMFRAYGPTLKAWAIEQKDLQETIDQVSYNTSTLAQTIASTKPLPLFDENASET